MPSSAARCRQLFVLICFVLVRIRNFASKEGQKEKMWEESFFQLIHTLSDLFGNSIPTILACVAVVGQIKCKSFIIDPLFRENRFIKG